MKNLYGYTDARIEDKIDKLTSVSNRSEAIELCDEAGIDIMHDTLGEFIIKVFAYATDTPVEQFDRRLIEFSEEDFDKYFGTLGVVTYKQTTD